ncbi:proposed homoserine kinase [Methanohalobium evestigatum Z-7303]|uniref:2,3-bisphosphoglycerate-independent phosphoglycerate mutase n=1 Tax=Methanohalobium evestigatum (strain ATCC BAA-1072 / DSM 3721 / NBRC 107634 / OCM 161 / Z-7303) TaxID=644295 RepID=D7EBL6_METEZ|nr:cofactor-independent phosphoglycerate mutase [Methanohalobium evestigatum]ADI74858.1 proposed homoserine kinase [Methanohalobium evestigatum Z-7303]
MKYIVLIGDGMGDYPIKELDNQTILQNAKTPNMDYIAKHGITGLAKNVPEGMHPGSDIANMSIIGYDTKKYYTGRAPLEAASMGITLEKDDVAFRCNLITINNDIIKDYSAGHIATEDAKILVKEINQQLGNANIQFYPGMSYKHLMVAKNNIGADANCTPPHDIMGKDKNTHMPSGKDSGTLSDLIDRSYMVLKDHWVNTDRINSGKSPANSIWLWGQGYAPEIPHFKKLYGLSGSIISAVDLIKGIGTYAGLDVIDVPGATGYLDTNYSGKAEYAIESLQNHDIAIVHVEAPDEAGHMGSIDAKTQAIEDFDRMVVGKILEFVQNDKLNEDYTILVTPDHPTPISLNTHTSDPVPFAIYSTIIKHPDEVESFNEKSMINGCLETVNGNNIINLMLDLNQ